MSGAVVDRAPSPNRSGLSSTTSRWVVLAAVAVGLLFGALACAAGLAGGVAHGAAHPAVLESDDMPASHAAHLAPMADSGAHPAPPSDDDGDHPASSSPAGNHPGMACVVAVDLRFPAPTSLSTSDSHEILLLGLRGGHPADVDPPVPRCS